MSRLDLYHQVHAMRDQAKGTVRYGRRHDDVSVLKATLAFIALALITIAGLCWGTDPVQTLLMVLRGQP